MQVAIEMNDNEWNEEISAEYTSDAQEEANNCETTDEETEGRAGEPEDDNTNEETFSEEKDDSAREDETLTTEELVDTINDEWENGQGKSKMRIGNLIFTHRYDGDAEKARSKNPKKENSYKDICDHKKLKMDPKELGRCVRAAIQKVEYETENVVCTEMSFHALLEAAKLPEKKDRLKLGREAVEKGWTVREIKKAVEDMKKAEAAKAITKEEAFKLLKQLKGVLTNEKLRNFLKSKDRLQSDLESEHRIELSKIANHMARQMEEWSPMLDSTRKTITRIEFAGEEAAA